MVFQQFNLFPHMTALQNCIEAPIEVLGLKKEEAEERALDLLELVGLTDKKDQHPSRLSGGQQQRVAIARAILTKPKILLADEPTGNLDEENSLIVSRALEILLTRYNSTIIIATHSENLANRLNKKLLIKNKKIREI